MSELKLSEIEYKAAKELKQVKGNFGDAKAKRACAAGAIAYYLSHGKTCNPDELSPEMRLLYQQMRREFFAKTDREITVMNDYYGWKFKKFGKEAEKVGM